MSKMIKLLNKANQMKEEQYSMSVVNDQLAVGKVEQPLSNSPKKPSIEDQPQVEQNGTWENGYDHHSQTSNTVSLALMVLVAMVAVASLFVSYKAFTVINQNQTTFFQLLEKQDIQSQKLTELTTIMQDIRESDGRAVHSLGSKVSLLTAKLDQSQLSLENLAGDQSILKSTTEDLRSSNRLILNKYISLNEEVRGLKREVQVIKNAEMSKVE